ncbi:putative short chain dehydrogenase [Jimgerdemannia flammicorona]|uniref:Putative short chain dehydrogenase n=1 Tax=Jimgerdemannia flammicorona TaxID=994334 RepID=A0A433DDS6_9FUNG|nr:putative short chain dehydrogenase [Jimgerdemannia flammicorona]
MQNSVSKGLAVIVGVGPGVGAALARKFSSKYTVALFARNSSMYIRGTISGSLAEVQKGARVEGEFILSVGLSYLDTLNSEIEQTGGKVSPPFYFIGSFSRTLSRLIYQPSAASPQAASFPCDVGSEESVKSAFAALKTQFSDTPIELAVYNASVYVRGNILEMEASEFESAWKVICMGAFLVSKEVVPGMLERKRGTLIFTGATASLRGSAKFAPFAVGKFGLRALSQSLAREFGPQGVHVAHVIVDGAIDTPRIRGMAATFNKNPETEMLNPDRIADAYSYLHEQHPSTWTHELDLRPAVEKF